MWGADRQPAVDMESDEMKRFTATGRPYTKPEYSTLASYNDGGFSAGGAKLLPVKYTDDSLISIPVRPPHDVSDRPRRKSSFFSKITGKNQGNSNFAMKKVTRREYLAKYAKDDNGHYIGTEEPAEDCILKEGDPARWTYGRGSEVNSLGGSTLAPPSETTWGKGFEANESKDDGVIR